MNDDRLMTQEAFAELAGVTQPAISQMIAKGRLATRKGGLIDHTDALSVDYIMRHPLQRRRAERLRKAQIDDQDNEGDDDLFSAAEVEELLRQAFKMDQENVVLAIESNTWTDPEKIAKAARAAKDPKAAKTVARRAFNAFLKKLSADLADWGERFVKAWQDDDLDYFLNGPSDEDLEAAQAKSKSGSGGGGVSA